jgi:DNA-binding GntR family transcriptional regulator
VPGSSHRDKLTSVPGPSPSPSAATSVHNVDGNLVAPRPGDLPVQALARYFAGTPVRGRTTEAVSDALREAILDGVLPPSTWLREDELAVTFKVSRTPVREALRRLADEGLAVKTAHHGTVVAPLSMEDILALYVVRVDLEGLAARLAATRCPPGLVSRLQAAHSRMKVSAARQDAPSLWQENLTFHRLIREAAGNSYLERFLTQVEHAVRRVPSSFTHPARAAAVLGEHEEIIAAIEEHDGDAAERAARAHMRRAHHVRIASVLGVPLSEVEDGEHGRVGR